MFNVTIDSTVLPKHILGYPSLAFIAPLLCLTLMTLLLSNISITKPSKVFLLDFTCYKPPASLMWSKDMVMERSRLYCGHSGATLEFMRKVLERSGVGHCTYLPESFLRNPPNPCLEEARKEAEMVIFGAVDDLFSKTGVRGNDIGILIVNCCIFNPAPSLCAMIVNRYKLGQNILSYNITGMGCSAGLTAIGLANQLLQVRHNSYALVVSTENITENRYNGNNRSMLLINCFFRVGGAAILLSNRPSDSKNAKYQLLRTVRSHTADSERSYKCILREEGVTISTDLLTEAGKAIEANVKTLGGLVLPVSEQILWLTNYLLRYFHVPKIEPYVPNFKKVINHSIIHVGGKPVMDEVERKLGFSEVDMEPSRMTLYRFGNTSSSSVWYGLAYAEAKGRVKRVDRVWQVSFGSGFKCSSLIWQAIRTIDIEERNPWSDEIDGFPVELNTIGSFPNYFEPSDKSE